MKILAFILVFVLAGYSYADKFDEYGRWVAVNSVTLAAGDYSILGTVIATDRDQEFNVILYGDTGGDSLKFTLTVFGGFSYALTDSSKFINLISSTVAQVKTEKTYAVSDTLTGNEMFPFMYLTLRNDHADSSATFDVVMHARKRTVTSIRLR